jgi:hypothetical protein
MEIFFGKFCGKNNYEEKIYDDKFLSKEAFAFLLAVIGTCFVRE